MRYDEVTASNLLEIDRQGKVISGQGKINDTGYIIQVVINKSRQDIIVAHKISKNLRAETINFNNYEE